MVGETSIGDFKVTPDGRIIRRIKKFYPNRDLYEGDFVDSVRHGQGVLITAAGIRYEGEFRNNIFNGYGILTWPTFEEYGVQYVGRRYEGDFKDNQRHGKGIFIVGNGDFYTGMFEKGLYHGTGTLKCEEGKFEGEWSCGKPSGKMRVEYANGNVYEGEMLIGYYHGKGKLIYADNKGYYEGQWLRNEMHGEGERVYSNGNRYNGSFFEGKLHGEGRMAFSNGDQYVGEWRNGQFDGKGVLLYESGERYDGTFKKGVFYGDGKFTYKDGGTYTGEYLNTKLSSFSSLVSYPLCDGLRHGFGCRVWADGTKYDGPWRHDRMCGAGILYLTDGTKYEGEFVNNVRYGFGTQFYGNLVGIKFVCPLGRSHPGFGYCTYKGNWKHGLFWGLGDFTCDDGRCYSGEWEAGKRHGTGKQSLFRKGDKGDEKRMFTGGVDSLYRAEIYEGQWVNNERHGNGVITYPNGDTIEGAFCNGQLHGVAIYTFAANQKENKPKRLRRARYHMGYRVEWLEEIKKRRQHVFEVKPKSPSSRTPSRATASPSPSR